MTSGVYERHFEIDGKNYHLILNPATGYPYDNGLISVTILSEESVDGDGLSTTCFSLGLEKDWSLRIPWMESTHALSMRITMFTIRMEWKTLLSNSNI